MQALLLLLLAIVMIGSFFEVICALALSLLFPELVLPETSYPTRIFSSFLVPPFFLCRPNKKENIFHLDELGEGE